MRSTTRFRNASSRFQRFARLNSARPFVVTILRQQSPFRRLYASTSTTKYTVEQSVERNAPPQWLSFKGFNGNEEKVPVIQACLNAGDISRALQILQKTIGHSTTDEAVHLVHVFLKHSVSCVPVEEVISYYEQLLKTRRFRADAISYAILCQAAMVQEKASNSSFPILRKLVRNWRRMNHSLSEILMVGSLVFSKKEASVLAELFRLPLHVYSGEERDKMQLADLYDSISKNFANAQPDFVSQDQLLSVKTRNIGLDMLKNTLSAIQANSKDQLEIDRAALDIGEEADPYNAARQRLMEKKALESSIAEWRHSYNEILRRGENPPHSRSLNALLYVWYEKLEALIQEEFRQIEDSENNKASPYKSRTRAEYAQYLKLLSPSKLAAITVLEMLTFVTNKRYCTGVRSTFALMSVGRAFEKEYFSEQLQKIEAEGNLPKSVDSKKLFSSPRLFNSFVKKIRDNEDNGIVQSSLYQPWSPNILVKVASVTVSLLINSAKIRDSALDPETKSTVFQDSSAFQHGYRYLAGRKVGVIVAHPVLYDILASELSGAHLPPYRLPMLVKPRPWLMWNSGGYYYSSESVLRFKESHEQLLYLKAASDSGQLKDLLEGLTALGNVGWKVNRKVYDMLVKIWNTGESFLSIPSANTTLDIQEMPEKSIDPSARAEWLRMLKERSLDFASQHSQRCEFNYTLEIAKAFLHETFYFPHNVDFRGRAYPIPSHLHHVNSDFCRSLLIFAEGKPLGEEGFQWLKVQLANLFGKNKSTIQERIDFVDNHLQDIFNSVDKPLDGEQFWTKADDPFQALAVCFEIADAIRSGDPSSFISHVPVQQDGTCNGLQHYAALGGDPEGAREVNLEPSNRPNDVYAAVAARVISILKKEAAAGDPMAELLKDRVTRTVIKQPVMTNVYGVTYVGARAQIEKQLKLQEDIPKDLLRDASAFLAKRVFQSLRALFKRAHEIQDWLADCAALIAHSVPEEALKQKELDKMTAVVWTTPLNLPVVQPYRKFPSKQITTNLQSVYLEDPDSNAPVDPRKQTTAVPPNFIHSLDATHMFMTCLKCKKRNITFVSVHDSYWTHAASVAELNGLLREAFVELHSRDILGDLKREFEDRYKNHYVHNHYPVDSPAGQYLLQQGATAKRSVVKGWAPLTFPEVPERGTFDIRSVLHSQYFFS
ncbi:RNA polymerase [Schizosaccharomyces japonicus yFS275]|uniref:DNA-directed RNA polymerase n=1 Tax=Schizosaccharomyces japonicus (strain yFS275 / FY16936) TaxID=402676 RepID=B6K333_SCHJY|nr:RNA polymerase [Schizosaccharomyces japonicus yFS275]EEB07890.1 RNA polymerase [Schizosaccharomyces japonicus yFS275]